MMNEESLKDWEQNNIELLTSREMGEWLHRRDMNARPQGEWIYDTEHSITIDMHKCSVCGCDGHTHFNFCPNCGADMRGDN